MTIYSVNDPLFAAYGQVVTGLEDAVAQILPALSKVPLPEGTGYVPTEPLFNLGTVDFILLLAKQEDVKEGVLETSKVKAFLVPAGTLVEVFATSLHYAPCCAGGNDSFRVMVALPRGTNTDKPQIEAKTPEDRLLWARNKWLIAHAESSEAADGAFVGLTGPNLEV